MPLKNPDMNSKTLNLLLLALIAIVTLGITSATAQPGPVYVSVLGDDGNTGESPREALRTITRALLLDAPHIVIADSGTYDTFSVTNPVIIEAAPGIAALIPATSASAAASINVGAGETVPLRGLSFTGAVQTRVYHDTWKRECRELCSR